MKLEITDNNSQEQTIDNVKRVSIWVTEDKKFDLHFNRFGELEIYKQTFDEESSTISIKPSVSNFINLI